MKMTKEIEDFIRYLNQCYDDSYLDTMEIEKAPGRIYLQDPAEMDFKSIDVCYWDAKHVVIEGKTLSERGNLLLEGKKVVIGDELEVCTVKTPYKDYVIRYWAKGVVTGIEPTKGIFYLSLGSKSRTGAVIKINFHDPAHEPQVRWPDPSVSKRGK